MLKNVYLTFTFVLALGCAAWAQTGAIKGKVIDKTTNEPLPFASVVAEINGSQAGGAQTDFDGNFTIKPLQPGNYNLKATFVGYQTTEIKGVVVSVDKITFADVKLGKGAVDITQVDVVDYKVPLIDKGNPAVQTTITAEEIKAIPTRDVKSVAATAAGVYQRDEGDDLNVRGSRDNATDFYIDGIRVRGSQQVPQSAIEQVTVVTGGVPAQYGDATGGIITITTKGPSKDFTGGIELVTSELFDKYGYNLAGLNLRGPILNKKDKDGNKTPVLGFALSGEFLSEKDRDPSAVKIYKVKDDVLNDIKKTPYIQNPNGNGVINRTELIRSSDLEKIKSKQNVEAQGFKANLKLDYQPVKNFNVQIGGSMDMIDKREYIWERSLFNYDHNDQILDNNYRAYIRFTQRFGSASGEENKSLIKNAYYSLQFDYLHRNFVDQDDMHKDDHFSYGYNGKFKSYRRPVYAITGVDTITGVPNAWEFTGYQDTLVVFTPTGVNPDVEAYTSTSLSFANPNYASDATTFNETGVSNFSNISGNYSNIFQILNNGGILNGGAPSTVYSMWRNTGLVFNLYDERIQDQFRASVTGSADIKNHAISIGFEFEKRTDRQFAIGGIGLWNVMYNLANTPTTLNEADTAAAYSYSSGDTLFHNSSYTSDGTVGFYENVRNRLGLGLNEYVDVFSYDPSNFSLDLFTPDELFTGNSGLGTYNYFGFDHVGKKSNSNASFDDFFSKKDANGNFLREVPAFQPIYMAGYIQDQFAINDLIFNIGLRVDRYDANQKVLKDKYLLYQARTVGELEAEFGNFSAPGNVGDDFVVYVEDKANPSVDQIVGYRSGDRWFDKDGNEVLDPNILQEATATGILAPYRVRPDERIDDKEGTFKASNSFEDYTPQLTFMPRVAFQFSITDQAEFFANYSILTQRPPDRSRNNPIQYLFFETQAPTYNNPDLKPERTTNYEIGFRQILSRSSVFTISAFYRELKDMIQFQQIVYADPKTYTTYGNVDFGTVKGLTLGYDLRRTGNIRVGLNYTLQFADGTGSGDRSAVDLVNSNQPNLRVLIPLDFDQRHSFAMSFDYRYGEGKDYNGPVLFNKQIFANTGANIQFRAGSGTPYSRQYSVTAEGNEIGVQTQGSSKIKGGINAARLPWNYRVDVKVDKDFAINIGKGENKMKKYYLNVYLQVQNLLNAKNIISVYRYTGNADDDGYLDSALGQSYVSTQYDADAFSDLYRIKVNNPNNYSIPRRMRLGIGFTF